MRGPVITRSFISAVFVAGVIGLNACSPIVAQRGAMPDVDAIATIMPNKSTKNDVERTLGSPSSINMYGDETWLYIGETTETVAFLESKVNERSVLLITFDAKGVVASMESHGLDEARDIRPVDRITPTVGKNMTAIDQLIGNLNRFGKIGEKIDKKK